MRKSKELQAVLSAEKDLDEHNEMIEKVKPQIEKEELDDLLSINRAKNGAFKNAVGILFKASIDEYITWMAGEYESN